jgi:hypothetical protein
MRITNELTGTSPMLMHNAQLADPDHPLVREIANITGKRTKTEEDRREISRLEWYGGLYLFPGIDGPALPTANIRRCLVEAGKITRNGKDVTRAVTFADLAVPLVYDGPRDPAQLYARPEFSNRASVKIGTSRTMRVRPQFIKWAAVAEAELVDTVLDLADLRLIAERAGIAEGMGDNRVNGYGRFVATVKA